VIAGRREPLDHAAAFFSFRLLPPFSYNLLEAAKHLIEGMVFKHQQDDVLPTSRQSKIGVTRRSLQARDEATALVNLLMKKA